MVRLFTVGLAAQAWAGLVIDEPIYDFGTRYNTLPITHAWKLRNTGTTDLEIGAVISGCDRCLSFALDRYEIKPGTHSDLHVILEPLGHEGAIEKSLTIESNTGGAPRKVTIRGRFLRAYRLAPAALTFTQSTGREEAQWQDLHVTPLTPLKGTLQQVLSTDEKVKGTVVPGKKPGSYTIHVECLPDWPDGRSEVELRIYSDHPEDPVGRILVQVHQPSELQAIPGKLLLERMNRPQKRLLSISGRASFQLEAVQASHPAIKWQVMRGSRPGRYRLSVKVHIPAGAEDFGPESLTLRFRGGRELQVPVVYQPLSRDNPLDDIRTAPE